MILLGAIPAAILALVVDFALGAVGWALDPGRRASKSNRSSRLSRAACILAAFLLAAAATVGYARARPDITIASKNFTEQLILGQMMALLIEEHTDLTVDRRFCLGGTMLCHGALVNGEIDLYAEYTGTGLTAVLDLPPQSDPQQVYARVAREYRQRWQLEWLAPFGINNTYAITVRKDDAATHGWERISDLADGASRLRAGLTAEFAERPDGYPGLRECYGFSFGSVTDIDAGLMYDAIAAGEVDVIAAFATDGRIDAYDLKPLLDDQQFFPPYLAAPVARRETLHRFPQLRKVLALLANALDDPTMRSLSFSVDSSQQSPEQAARHFLTRRGLLSARH